MCMFTCLTPSFPQSHTDHHAGGSKQKGKARIWAKDPLLPAAAVLACSDVLPARRSALPPPLPFLFLVCLSVCYPTRLPWLYLRPLLAPALPRA